MNAKKRVLIVDDVVTNVMVLIETLKSDYAVIAANSGEKALKLAFSAEPPDIILLDIMMPVMSGYEVCRRLKAVEVTKDIPIIFITAMTEIQDEEKGLELGAVDYISKPFNPELVKKRVHNQLELKAHRDNLEELLRIRTKEVNLIQEVTIESLATLAEYRDPETGGHIKRTRNYVRVLADNLVKKGIYTEFLNYETTHLLYLSAPLHDIGKVGIPDNILLKPGKLTVEEYEIMKNHAIYGYKAIEVAVKRLGKDSFLKVAAEIAYSHHEKWDGSGYPRGLKGQDIPISGRLMAISDVYDALISKRVYKPPYSHKVARQIIEEGRGSHFDPALVDLFLEVDEEFVTYALKYADHDEERATLLKN